MKNSLIFLAVIAMGLLVARWLELPTEPARWTGAKDPLDEAVAPLVEG